ncbi:MAG: AAA family ATPase [archaeon]
MIVHRLKTSGFQIMGDPLSFEFPEEGRIGILGQNESGKTTLFEAIEYALYGLKRGRGAEESRENLVTWGENEARLEIEFTSGQDRYLLYRTFDVQGNHRARLLPIVDGEEASANALTSLTEIETKIENITGMDRDSFTKLVYVRQKDLDALKELAKAKREQLVNKVMGIEIFDDAAAKAKSDFSSSEVELEKKAVELDSVRKNAQRYKEKLDQKQDLEAQITELKGKLQDTERDLKKAQNALEGYEWLSKVTSTRGLAKSFEEQRTQTQQDVETAKSLRSQAETYDNVLRKYKPEVERLEVLRSEFSNIKSHMEESHNALASLTSRENEAATRAGLTAEDRELLGQDLQAEKQHQLLMLIASPVLALVIAVAGVLLSQIVVSLLAILPVALAVRSYLKYEKADRTLSSGVEIQVLRTQITEGTRRHEQARTKMNSLLAEARFSSPEQVDLALLNVANELQLATGQESIQAVEALMNNTLLNVRKIEQSNPTRRLDQLNSRLQETHQEIERLEKTKPDSADTLQYDRDLHEQAKEKAEALQGAYTKLDREFQQNIGTFNSIEKDLQHLVADFNRLPTLEADYRSLEEKATVTRFVINELGETSKELRGKVIPHASFIVNQILPTLTDSRYSQFEITEDLRFKVYSSEAGGYKERELFSGGTQDQFLIALRLAFTQSILDSRVMADRYSLLMDECISSSDDQRKQGIFEVLQAMKKTFSQIFIIAHEDISNYVDHSITLGRNERGYTEIRSKSW